ncbi:MAG: hypothetical protein HYV07_14940 [Deltaproteobacteria bacterium]|nr:hypothetical protein [Deltaproteobacteria bacterium]
MALLTSSALSAYAQGEPPVDDWEGEDGTIDEEEGSVDEVEDGEEGADPEGEDPEGELDAEDLEGEESIEEPVPIDPAAAADAAAAALTSELERRSYRFCTDATYVPSASAHEELSELAALATDGLCPRIEGSIAKSIDSSERFPALARRLILVFVLLIPGLLLLRGLRSRAFGAPRPAPHAALVLSKAKAELDAGDLSAALDDLELALLTHVVSRAPALRPGATMREASVLIEDRAERELATRVVEACERGRYGAAESVGVDELRSLIDALLGAVRRSSMGRVSGVLVALLTLGSSSCNSESPALTLSHEPEGFAAFVRLLDAASIDARPFEGLPRDLPEAASVVVVRTSQLDSFDLDPPLDQGLAVVLLDDAGTAPGLLPVVRTAPRAAATLEPAVGGFCGQDPEVLGAIANGPIMLPVPGLVPRAGSRLSVVSHHPLELTPILWIGADRTHLAALGAHRIGERGEELPGCIFLFSSASVLSNASMARKENARFAVAFVASLLTEGDEVLFVEAARPKGLALLGVLLGSRAGSFAAHLGTFLALLILALGARFGRGYRLEDPPDHGLTEHIRSFGRLVDRARRTRFRGSKPLFP